MYVIVVTLQCKPGHRDTFLAAAKDDAAHSRKNEPGCVRFDVYQDQTDVNKFVFVEAYKDEAAFKQHMTMPHFQVWRAATKDIMGGPSSAVRCTNIVPSDKDWR
ncbi:MAG: antibiotic biosynthesis monooxygenase [Chloroflexi bacterium]|nr:antibiotic biosynthesis monooxygenase [Chloroflexota bacterium]